MDTRSSVLCKDLGTAEFSERHTTLSLACPLVFLSSVITLLNLATRQKILYKTFSCVVVIDHSFMYTVPVLHFSIHNMCACLCEDAQTFIFINCVFWNI